MARQHRSDEFFAVDLSDENGIPVGHLEYEGRIYPDRITNDIKRFFQTGEIPEQNNVSYSIMPEPDEDLAQWSDRLGWTDEQRDEIYRRMSVEKRAAVMRTRERMEAKQQREKHRANIVHNANDLATWLKQPNVKEGKYVPDFLKDSVLSALQGIDLGSQSREGGQIVQNWRRSMQNLANTLTQYQLHQTGENSDARFDGV